MFNTNDSKREFSILYVEDDDETREGYILLFSRIAKDVYIAKNGKEGLEAFKKYSPDITITDSKMPLMDGLEMTQRIKEIDKNAHIIFMSADNDDEFVKKVKECGVEHFLVKPIPRRQLLDAINKSIASLKFDK